MFLPHLHSHFSNRLFLLILAFLLLVAATGGHRRHSRVHPAFLDAIHASPNTPQSCSP